VGFSVPPKFTAEPESQAVVQKSAVLFTSVFEGTPPFMVKWFKDGKELIGRPSCKIRLEEYSSSVELPSVGTQQSGTYSCQVSNEAGQVNSAAQLLVKGRTILLFGPSSSLCHLFLSISTATFSYRFLTRNTFVVFRLTFLVSVILTVT